MVIVVAKNKKSDSETSFLTREDLRKSRHVNRTCEFGDFPPKKLSKSLEELDLISLRTTRVNKEEDGLSKCKKQKEGTDFCSPLSSDIQKLAGKTILNLLMLNAWRKQKQNYKLIQEKVENLNEKLEGFEMQVYLLRQLLNAEKGRVESANENIQALVQKMEECNKDRSDIFKKREETETKFKELVKYCSEMEQTLKEKENKVITYMQDAEDLQQELQSERSLVAAMRTKEVTLNERVVYLETYLTNKREENERLRNVNSTLRGEISTQKDVCYNFMVSLEETREVLSESEDARRNLESSLEHKSEEIKQLNSTVAALQQKLLEEDEKNGLLAKTVLEKTNELSAMEEKLQEIAKSNFYTIAGFDKLPSICAKIPVACICTIGSLLLPFPSYRI